jgi:uncharacterized protein
MNRLKELTHQHPLMSYVLLCFGITWPVWFCVPLVAGADWTLGKIVTGIGFGPALAAIALDRLRGTGAAIGSRRWTAVFLPTAFIVTCLDMSSLLTGDAISAAGMASTHATGLTFTGWISTLVAGTVSGFMVASVACSRNSRLASLLEWKLPVRWWLLALFLPTS